MSGTEQVSVNVFPHWMALHVSALAASPGLSM